MVTHDEVAAALAALAGAFFVAFGLAAALAAFGLVAFLATALAAAGLAALLAAGLLGDEGLAAAVLGAAFGLAAAFFVDVVFFAAVALAAAGFFAADLGFAEDAGLAVCIQVRRQRAVLCVDRLTQYLQAGTLDAAVCCTPAIQQELTTVVACGLRPCLATALRPDLWLSLQCILLTAALALSLYIPRVSAGCTMRRVRNRQVRAGCYDGSGMLCRTFGLAAVFFAAGLAAAGADSVEAAAAAGFAALGLVTLGFLGLASPAGFLAAGFFGFAAGFSVLRLPSLYEAFTCTSGPA